LPPGAACGKNGAACKSGNCVDGVCCTVKACSACTRCNINGSGTCDVFTGAATATECPGDAICGGGRCALGKCDYDPPSKVCAAICAAGSETVSRCSSGKCNATPAAACSPHTCDAAGEVCTTGCQVDSDCVSGSLCDRTAAHVDGQGRCVVPSTIATVTNGMNLQTAVDAAIKAGQRVVRVGAGTYGALSISAGDVTLIGVGFPVIDAPGSGAAITVDGGARLALQGLIVQGASDGDGVLCRKGGAAQNSKLLIVESTLKGNSQHAIESVDCDVELRRSKVQNNTGGGLSLTTGRFDLVNTLISNNGVSGTGGVQLVNAAATSVIVNNTIARNVAGSGTISGISCTNVIVSLKNQIVWENVAGTTQAQGCTFVSSDVPGGSGTNIALDPLFAGSLAGDFSLKTTPSLSPCINQGASTAGVTVLDITGGPRKKGSAPDLGAYEMQ